MRKIFFSLLAAWMVSGATAWAQSSFVLCYNSATKAITVESRCGAGRSTISGSNLGSIAGKGVSYSKCYTQSGQTSGAPSSGQLAFALRCAKTSDVMVEDTFEPSSNTAARPALGSKLLLYSSGKVPNGMQISSQATPNTFYTLKASIVCCPQ